jgi:hypothetical protein
MSAIADLHELVNRLSGGNSGNPELLMMHKESRVAGAAAAAPIVGFATSLWEYEGTPSHGAVPPTTVAYPDNTTQGSWKQTNPSGGRQKWASSIGGTVTSPGTLVVFDRLAHISGLSGTTITAQNVLATAITRNTNGVGNFIFGEIYTQVGGTATTITANYTNQAGVAGQTSQAVVFGNTGRREAQRFFEISLAAGDTGVQAVNTVTVLASTLVAGNFGIGIGHKVASLMVGTNSMADIRSFLDGPLTEILTGACLSWYWLPAVATAMVCDMWSTTLER